MDREEFRRIQTRRSFFEQCAGGIGIAALSQLMAATTPSGSRAGRPTQLVRSSELSWSASCCSLSVREGAGLDGVVAGCVVAGGVVAADGATVGAARAG